MRSPDAAAQNQQDSPCTRRTILVINVTEAVRVGKGRGEVKHNVPLPPKSATVENDDVFYRVGNLRS